MASSEDDAQSQLLSAYSNVDEGVLRSSVHPKINEALDHLIRYPVTLTYGEFLQSSGWLNDAKDKIQRSPASMVKLMEQAWEAGNVMAVMQSLDSKMGSGIEPYVCEVLNKVLNSGSGPQILVVHTPRLYPEARTGPLQEHPYSRPRVRFPEGAFDGRASRLRWLFAPPTNYSNRAAVNFRAWVID